MGVTPAYAMSPWEPVQSALFVRGFALVNPPFWSLFVEARLYLVAGLLALGATRPGAFRVFLPLGFGLLGLCLWEDAAFWVYATVWSAGGVTGWLVQTRYRFIRTGLSMLAIGYLLHLAFARPGQLSIYEPDAQLNQFMQVTWGLAYAALLFDLRWPLRWLALPQQVAGWSYTLYLLHWPYLVLVLSLSQVWIGVSPWRATCMTALAVLVALGTGAGPAIGPSGPPTSETCWSRLGSATLFELPVLTELIAASPPD
ncbi:MAG: hypothetical protein IPO19_14010 [Rhodoferax sp.]|nr:hypothetical protein [Rhodoferax sp.]